MKPLSMNYIFARGVFKLFVTTHQLARPAALNVSHIQRSTAQNYSMQAYQKRKWLLSNYCSSEVVEISGKDLEMAFVIMSARPSHTLRRCRP
jgi:hypothetical protein